MDNNEPIIQALGAIFLALGTAAGDKTLRQARCLMRDLIDTGLPDRRTSDILEGLIASADEPGMSALKNSK